MKSMPRTLRKALPSLALFACLAMRSDTARQPPSRLGHLPRITLWAWERREDLRHIDPQTIAVAYLDQTLTLTPTVSTQPRRDPVAFPASATRIPVVRIEAPRYAVLTGTQRQQALEAILTTAREPNIAALQIDFDATVSQRPFYRSLLTDLRRQMPPTLPLSITALASWCSSDNWLRTLPIDEAVPMFFRMEPFRISAPGSRPTRAQTISYLDTYPIREPLCQTSLGLSTTEPWPSNTGSKRIYLFPDHGWQHELLTELPRRLP